jgi:cytochrome b subunit of formate dehydrogenase
MMSASAVYATFVVTGNTGGLTESGVDKVTAAYKQHLQRVQEIRKAQDERLRAEAAKSS